MTSSADQEASYVDSYYRARKEMWEARLDRGALEALDMLGIRQGNLYLDAGAGLGRLSAEIVRRGGYVVGVDVSDYAVSLARERYRERAHLEFRRLDLREMQFTEAFDGVLCYHVLEHLDCSDTDQVLRNLRQALKSGGTLVLAVPVNDRSRLKVAVYRLLKGTRAGGAEKVIDSTHLCWWTMEEVITKVRFAGFSVRDIRIYGYLGIPFPRTLRKLRLIRQLTSAVTLRCVRDGGGSSSTDPET